MRKTFTVRISGDHHTLIAYVRRRAAKQGIKLVGDEIKGTFTGMMTGHYEVTEGKARITVTNKPHFYSWDAVEKWLGTNLLQPVQVGAKHTATQHDGGSPVEGPAEAASRASESAEASSPAETGSSLPQ